MSSQTSIPEFSAKEEEFYVNQAITTRVYDVAIPSALDTMPILSERLGHRVLLKREDQQSIFSFKLRGAYQHMVHLPKETLDKGVVACSAGNHAQGVALAARVLKTRAVICMPQTAPEIKVSAIRALGAEIRFSGDSFSEAFDDSLKVAEQEGLHIVPAFDDKYVIAGNATVGLELIQRSKHRPDAVFIPVGGGGMLAGVAVLIKHFCPHVRIYGIEAKDSASMHAARSAGEPVRLKNVGLFADGVAVAQAGNESFRIARKYVDDLIEVSNDEICTAIKDVYNDTRTILETSGAIGVAGLKAWAKASKEENQNLVAIATGANMDFNTLRHIAERAEIGEKTEAVIGVKIPEKKGSFRRFCSIIGTKLSVSEFNYRYSDPQQADIFLGVRSKNPADLPDLLQRLNQAGHEARDFSNNEVAKLHLRHMIGGKLKRSMNERLFRFEFPERPSALLDFLTMMDPYGFNITLFHYRNHGADYSRILTGIQLKDGQYPDFERFAQEVGYRYKEESDNEAYRTFLVEQP